jgi:hypothetical protein
VKFLECIECGNQTRDPDGFCVLCKKQINQIHKELMDLLAKDKKRNLKENKIRLSGSDKRVPSISRKAKLKSKVLSN